MGGWLVAGWVGGRLSEGARVRVRGGVRVRVRVSVRMILL